MRLIYYILLGLVNFFIFIGEATRFLLFIPFKFLQFLNRYFLRLPKLLYEGITKFGEVIVKRIENIRTIRFSVPKKKSRPLPVPVIGKPSKRKKALLNFLFKAKYFVTGFVVAAVILFGYQTYALVESLPSPKSIGKVNYPLSTHMFDRNGKSLYEFYREQNRTPIKVADIKPYVYQAAIAIEDKDFFNHYGVSPIGGIARAIKEMIVTKQVQGGSTITQQLVKSALLTPERTVVRKIKEIILALWAERLFTKQQILEMYLNQVPYGGSSYGIEEASKAYFDKPAKDLTIDEAALLAGLPQAPSVYSPFVNPQLAKARRDDVLKKMWEQKYITEKQYLETKPKELPITIPKTAIRAPHFVFYVKSQLEKKFGIRNVEEGGLRVLTSLDLNIQERAEEILREELEKVRPLNVTNGAVLITRPATGEILAMVGSIDYFASPSGAFNVTTALRQPGSSIKPLMYSLALERGQTAATMIDDSPVVFQSPGGEAYRPVNYDSRFHGRLPLRYALANSYNVPAVKTLNSLGVDAFVDQARELGISTWNDSSRFGLSLTLGGGDVKMVDMAKAYGVFANLGNRVDIDPFIKVTNLNDDILYEQDEREQQVLNDGVSYIISDILSDNVARQQAFGVNSLLEIPGYKVAVKTGTTDDKKDNWTIGYTPEFMVVVWVGNNDNTPMNPALTSGITGAAPIWRRVMEHLVTTYSNKNTWFNKPEDIVEKTCYGNRKEYFLKGTESTFCQTRIGPTPSPKPN